MGFVSFTGRLLFTIAFFLSAWQDIGALGYYGESKMKFLRPRYEAAYRHFLPNHGVKYLVAAGIGFKGLGSILFILGSPIGAYLLLLYLSTTMPALIHFCSKPLGRQDDFLRSFSQSAQELALSGALLFFLAMKRSIRRRQSKKRPPKAKSA